ncbi:MAG: hypothetical protein ACPGTP_06350 [Bacteroidia bacterium]
MDNNKSSKALPIFVILFLASLALSAFLFFKYAKNAALIQQQNNELTSAYESLNLKADSLQKELDIALQQIEIKINENLAQVDLKEDLREQLEAQKSELQASYAKISRLIAQGNTGTGNASSKKLLDARNEISSLTKQNEEYIVEIEETQKKYIEAKQLAADNGDTAFKYITKSDSLEKENEILNTKLNIASIVRIAGLKTSAMRTRKDNLEATDKASKTEQLKISFSVLPSNLTVTEDKKINIRIIESSGAVLTRDTDQLTDSDELFSLQESFEYDGSEKLITYFYDQEAAYKKGTYTIEVLHEDKLLDRSTFSLR